MQRQRRRKKKRKRSAIEEMISFTRKNKKYNKVTKSLTQLNAMIGMKAVKDSVVEQLMFLITNDGDTNGHFLNTVIQGAPGTGKTTVAKILYEIWTSLDIFKTSDKIEFKIMNRSDFVGSYMGHTANKTRKLLQRYSGNVIFIDEAYSLCGSEKDDYGKEALDEINAFMSEEAGKTIIIIAGYENSLKESFFSKNSGLQRRFNWSFTINKYTHEDLYNIFVKQLKTYGWTIESDCEEIFKQKYDLFENAGGDTANIAFKCKIEYSRRMWTKKKGEKKITKEDVEKAMNKHFQQKEEDKPFVNMYI
jgi:SpoVK/Ycf46/Vps4 family AAA+-type ATPase